MDLSISSQGLPMAVPSAPVFSVSVKVSREKQGKKVFVPGLEMPFCTAGPKALLASMFSMDCGYPWLVYQRRTFSTQHSGLLSRGQTLPSRSAARARISQKFFFHPEYWVSHMHGHGH